MRRVLLTILATVLVPGVAVVVVPYLILRATGDLVPPQAGIIEAVALLLALAGAAMVIWVSVAFVRTGQGTPIPVAPPENLVAEGLYRFVRNPMYFGALLTLFAEAVLFRSPWVLLYAGLLWLALHTFTVIIEEPQLEARFGDPYREYRSRTPRWIPRPPKK
jgi:protein-S-isoprenylcysteine O-methyltransferase Ste14